MRVMAGSLLCCDRNNQSWCRTGTSGLNSHLEPWHKVITPCSPTQAPAQRDPQARLLLSAFVTEQQALTLKNEHLEGQKVCLVQAGIQ